MGVYGIKKLDTQEPIIRVTGHELKRCEDIVGEGDLSIELNLSDAPTMGESAVAGTRGRNHSS